MWTRKGLVDLNFVVFLHLGTWRCWICPCTLSPDSAWVSQQAMNFLMDAEDMELAPKCVMRDNDTMFTAQFDEVFQTSGGDQAKHAAFTEPAGARGAVHPDAEGRVLGPVHDRGRTAPELHQPRMAAA
jgi:hypothetical protein